MKIFIENIINNKIQILFFKFLFLQNLKLFFFLIKNLILYCFLNFSKL